MKQLPGKRAYLIGDVARITGLSRDALRFYEKKGIISSEKLENGYRCYSDLDIYRLMHICYCRKMNISLGDLEEMMSGRKEPLEGTREHITRRLEEEEAELRRRQLAITRLRMTQRDMGRIEQCSNRCSVKMFPSAYVLDCCDSFQEGLERWFDLAASAEALDMTYFYTVLEYSGEEIVCKETQLLLYSQLAGLLGETFSAECYPKTQERECIYQVVNAESTTPGWEQLERMRRWGMEHELCAESRVYVNVMTGFFQGEKPLYSLEVYMPVKKR